MMNMSPQRANLINSLVLLIIGLWGFGASGWGSTTALIAPSFGVLFLILMPFFNKGNKTVIYAVMVLTLILMIALLRPLTREMGQNDYQGVLRVATMMFSCITTTVVYYRNFLYGGDINLGKKR